jgi:hypothetical protein
MKIVISAFILALVWTAALILIASTVGLHSTQGMWAGAIGLPGVVISNWAEAQLFHTYHRPLGYALMFLINWVFYCTVIQGVVGQASSLSAFSWRRRKTPTG